MNLSRHKRMSPQITPMPFTIRTLAPTDATELLRFERANQAWFEQHVEPRGADFYSDVGVQAHIAELLALHAQKRFHPTVIVDEATGHIVGRANLKAIDAEKGEAELGYRLAQSHTGQGLASLAAKHLIQAARSRWHLQRLVAHVREDNLASARVLLNNGFVRTDAMPGLVSIQGRMVDGWRYVCALG